jgi:hypothetical protein
MGKTVYNGHDHEFWFSLKIQQLIATINSIGVFEKIN